MRIRSDLSNRFASLVSGPEDELDLAEAALLIAKAEYPELDVHRYLSRLDEMASVVGRRLEGDPSTGFVIGEMNRFLFAEQGFSGNTRNYFDPRNSFLNDVMERKLGIPISLSLIYMEVGRRLGLPLAGVPFPGHFLVKLSVPAGEIVLDPFSGGLSLSRADLQDRLQGFIPDDKKHEIDLYSFLATATKKEILARMLRNLKRIYVELSDFHKALNVIQQLLIIAPNHPAEIRDRGYMYEKLECFRAAAEDYRCYLDLAPHAEDYDPVRAHYMAMRRVSTRLN